MTERRKKKSADALLEFFKINIKDLEEDFIENNDQSIFYYKIPLCNDYKKFGIKWDKFSLQLLNIFFDNKDMIYLSVYDIDYCRSSVLTLKI